MKIFVIGDGHSRIHEYAVSKAFKDLGYKVQEFYWYKYFKSENNLNKLILKFQNKFLIGPIINKLNFDIMKKAFNFKPNIIFIYRGTHVLPKTIKELSIKIPKCKIIGYNNDNPFASGHPKRLWSNFLKSINLYDLILAYRHENLNEFKKKGAKKVKLLRSWYIPEKNFNINLSKKEAFEYKSDVVFVGHYEDDGRLQYLEEIVKAGYKLKIFGPPYEWNKLLQKSKFLEHLSPVRLVWNLDYTKAISGAKIALCFFSKLNRDTYTRRCFEIPAIGTMLLSEYSKDMTSLFIEKKEVELFRTKKQMIEKIKFYIENEKERKKLAKKGQARILNGGNDVNSRMTNVIKWVNELDS